MIKHTIYVDVITYPCTNIEAILANICSKRVSDMTMVWLERQNGNSFVIFISIEKLCDKVVGFETSKKSYPYDNRMANCTDGLHWDVIGLIVHLV